MSTAYRTTCDTCGLDMLTTTEHTAHLIAQDHYCQPPAESVGQCGGCARRRVKINPDGHCRLCRVHSNVIALHRDPFDPDEAQHTCPRCGISLRGRDRPGRMGYCRDCITPARRDGLVHFNVGRAPRVPA